MNIPFKQFNASELSENIKKVVDFDPEEKSNLKQSIKKDILSRLLIFCNKTIYYIFEDEYIETEWKDMVSIHYVNTTYRTPKTVMRVQLFSKPELNNEEYLGFFTLRNINDTKIMLSYVYPNWKTLLQNLNEKCYFMTYKKKVHTYGKELIMHTYPLYVQDSAVTSCSHASMISMSKYLKGKYNYNNIRILDINNSYTYGRKKLYPTIGLDPIQMLEILDANGIPIDYKLYSKEMAQALRLHIDFCIESAMPVLLGIHIKGNEHVIQIIGHTLDDEGNKDYIIYDDSGYYTSNRRNSGREDIPFMDIISWAEIEEVLKDDSDKDETCGFIIYPLHEKVYILYDKLIEDHCRPLLKPLENSNSFTNKRVLIVDNRIVKKHLSNLLIVPNDKWDNEEIDETYDKEVENEIKQLLSHNLPHYIWVLELQHCNNKRSFILANPTLNPITRKNIFLTTTPIITEDTFKLLNEFN